MNENRDVLMVLPKRTIDAPSALKAKWDVDKDPQGITIFSQNHPVSRANWDDRDDFGMRRPAILVELPEGEDLDLFDAMISRLALAYENLPERYPLYIRISMNAIELIAHAARLGFVPYFGNWKESSSDQSEADWVIITNRLRERFPAKTAA